MTAALASTLLTLAMNPLGDLKRRLFDAAPWVGVGVVASHVLFIGGMATMACAVGLGWGSSLKTRKVLTEISSRASGSRLFWIGFWANSLGAVGSAATISVGVVLYLPPESYGLLGLALADLGVTLVIRKAMLRAVNGRTGPQDSPRTMSGSVAE